MNRPWWILKGALLRLPKPDSRSSLTFPLARSGLRVPILTISGSVSPLISHQGTEEAPPMSTVGLVSDNGSAEAMDVDRDV